METTSLGIGMHSTNMSAAGEMINKSMSARNLAYGRKNNAKIAKFYEAVVTMLHSMAADDKLNLLAEYGDTGKLNRNHSNLDDVLAETIIINLPASELEALVKDVKTDEAALKKDIKTIRMKQKRKRIKTSSFNSNSFEDVYGKLSHARNASQYAKLRKRLVGGFKVPKGMRTVYANLSREIKDLLRNYFDKIEVSALAAQMGIDITPDMKDKDVENSIINKTLLYVDLLVGKSKKKTNYGGAIVDRAPFDKILQLTTYAYVTGKPGLDARELVKIREEIKDAREQARIRFRLEQGHKFFNKRFNKAVRKGASKLKDAVNKGDLSATGIKNTDILLDIKNGKPKIKDPAELYALCTKYHIKFGLNEPLEKITVKLDREITRQKKRYFKLAKSLDMTDMFEYTIGNKTDGKTRDIASFSGKSGRRLTEMLEKGDIKYDDAKEAYVYTETGDIVKGSTSLKSQVGHVLTKTIPGFFKFGKKSGYKRSRFEKNLKEVGDDTLKDESGVHDKNKALKDSKEKEEKAFRKAKLDGVISQMYEHVPVISKDLKYGSKIYYSVPVTDVNGSSVPVSLVSSNIDDKYTKLSYVTPVLVTNKDIFETKQDDDGGSKDNNNQQNNTTPTYATGVKADVKKRKFTLFGKKERNAPIAVGVTAPTVGIDKKGNIKRDKKGKAGIDKAVATYSINGAVGDSNNKEIPATYLNDDAKSMHFNKYVSFGKKKNTGSLVQPVYVVNKEPGDKTYGWLTSEFPKYMLAMSNDVVAAPMGAGVITRPGLMAMAGVSTGMSAVEDAMKLADVAAGGLLGLNTGGSGKANSKITSFISGDSPAGLNDKNSFPEQVDIDWVNKSFNVKPIPTYATGVRGEVNKDTVRRFSEKERNAPMAVGFSSHVVKFNRKLDGISGETDIGEAIKVFNVNESAGIGENFTIGGKKTNLIELVNNMCNQLSTISEQLKSTNSQSNNSTSSSTTLVQPNISLPVIERSGTNNTPRLSSVGFTSSLDNILQGV